MNGRGDGLQVGQEAGLSPSQGGGAVSQQCLLAAGRTERLRFPPSPRAPLTRDVMALTEARVEDGAASTARRWRVR